MSRFALCIFIAAGIFGCQKNDFPDYSLLGPLRILTLQAVGTPEVNPGASVQLQPVVSDIGGQGRTLSVNVQSCWDPGIGLGATPSCPVPDANTNSSFAASTLGSNNTFTGLAPTFTVNIPSVTFKSDADKFNGINYLVIYTLSAADGSRITAFKRILVSDPSKTAKNQNPDISSVTSNGATLSSSNTFNLVVQTLYPAFSVGAENYQTKAPDGTFQTSSENIVVSWFVSDGTMKNDRSFSTGYAEWTPAPPPTTRDAVMVVVSHDGRGGESYQIFQFH